MCPAARTQWTAPLIFHPFEVACRYRDPQLQMNENYSYLFNLVENILKWLSFKHPFHSQQL